MSKRAIRRHHAKRMRKRAHRVHFGISEPYRTQYAKRVADNMKACSCGICTVYWPSHTQDTQDYSAAEQISEAAFIDTDTKGTP